MTERTAERSSEHEWRTAVIITAVGAALRFALGWWLPLQPDEAYYWLWTKHLSTGYFDHPPMIAWLIGAGTAVLGHSPLGVRAGCILAGTVAIGAIAATARRLGGDAAGLLAATAMTVLPLAAAGLVLATPDAPLLGASALTLYGVVRALEHEPGSRDARRWWMGAGAALGVAFASKYTSILIPVGVVIAVIAHPLLRPRLRELGPYLACLVATMVFLPVLIWNARHDWVSFRFQIDHGLGTLPGAGIRTAVRHEGDLIGGQLGLVSPVLLAMMAGAVGSAVRWRTRPAEYLLAVVSTGAMLFFVNSALHKHVEPNWPAPAYIGALVLLAVRRWSVRGATWVRAGITFAAVMTAIIYVHAVVPVLPIPPARDPVNRAFGWDALAAGGVRAAAEPAHSPGAGAWIAGNRYQDAAEIAFYADAADRTFALNLGGRRNQFDYWPGFPQRARRGDRLVLVLEDTREPHDVILRLTPFFASVLRGELVELRRGTTLITTRRIYSLDGWTGAWPE